MERGKEELGGLVRRGKFGIGKYRATESEIGSKEGGVGEGHRTLIFGQLIQLIQNTFLMKRKTERVGELSSTLPFFFFFCRKK